MLFHYFDATGAFPEFSPEDLFTVGDKKTDLPIRFLNLLQTICQSPAGQRSVAASIQAEFADLAHAVIMALVGHVGMQNIEGVVMTGGCALNVLVNQDVYNTLLSLEEQANATSQTSRSSRNVYVPPSPNDGGLTGKVFSISETA